MKAVPEHGSRATTASRTSRGARPSSTTCESPGRSGPRRCARRCTTRTSRVSTRPWPSIARHSRGDHVGGRAAPHLRAPFCARHPGRRAAQQGRDVRYKGQPIAVVAAEDEETAMAAVDAIETDFSKPRSSTSGSARGSRCPRHPPVGQLVSPFLEGEMDVRQIRKGDIDWAIDSTDVVVQGVYRPAAIEHAHSRRRFARSFQRRTAG